MSFPESHLEGAHPRHLRLPGDQFSSPVISLLSTCCPIMINVRFKSPPLTCRYSLFRRFQQLPYLRRVLRLPASRHLPCRPMFLTALLRSNGRTWRRRRLMLPPRRRSRWHRKNSRWVACVGVWYKHVWSLARRRIAAHQLGDFRFSHKNSPFDIGWLIQLAPIRHWLTHSTAPIRNRLTHSTAHIRPKPGSGVFC